MTHVLLTGGRDIPAGLGADMSRHRYDQAMLVALDLESGQSECVFTWRAPEEARASDGGSDIFKAGSWDGGLLLLCTETELLWVDPKGWRVVRHLSHPWFNDVHHAVRIGGRVHVVSTGLDAVLILGDDDTSVVEVVSSVPTPVFERHDRDTDWRKVPSTKPHPAHANYVYAYRDQTWVSRHIQGDTLPLGQTTGAVSVHPAGIHDGWVHNDRVWFTAVDGHLIAVDPDRGTREVWSLAELHGAQGLGHGWCRGLYPDQGLWWVGFSRVRRTRWIERARVLHDAVSGQQRHSAPTRLEAFDLASGRFVREITFERGPVHELSAIFSVLPAQPG